MVTSLARTRSAYDIYLAYGGETQGFILAKGENGRPLYRPGLTPDVAPQQRTDAFSYAHRLPSVDIPAAFEDFLYGAGFEDAPDVGTLGFKGYHYSRGVDLSWPRRGYLSPLLQTGGSTTEAPKKYVWSSLGLFCMTARYVFEWTGAAWTQRFDAGAGVTLTDLIEYKNSSGTYILLGIKGQPYRLTTDGTTWTQSEAVGGAPTFRAVAVATQAAGTSIVITKPTGTVQDDIMLAVVVIDVGETITAPAGWTGLASIASAAAIRTFWKRAGASEGADYTFSWTSSTRARGAIAAYSSVMSTGLPYDDEGSPSVSSLDAPAVDVFGSNRLAVALAGITNDDGGVTTFTFTPPAGYTERTDDGTGPAVTIAEKAVSAGTEDPAAFVASAAGTLSMVTAVVLKPSTPTGATDVARFAVRGQSSGAPVLWVVNSEGDIRSAVDPTSPSSWSAADATQMGQVSITIGGLEVINNVFYLVHDGGITSYDGTTVKTVWDSQTAVLTTADARPFMWVDNKPYFTFSGMLLRLDTETLTIEKVWPRGPQAGNAELNGTITAITGDEFNLYFALENGAGDVYFMKGDPTAPISIEGTPVYPFHTWAYRAGADCDAMLVVPASADAQSSTNPTLVFGDDLTADYFILPRPGLRPEDDTNYRFETAVDQTVYGSFINFRTQGFQKWLTRGDIEGEDLDADDTIALQYQTPGGTATTIATANANGRTTATISSEVLVTAVRSVGVFNNGASTTSPTLKGFVLHAAPNPPRDRLFTFAVQIADHQSINTGAETIYEAADQDAFIWDSLNSRVTLTDPWGTTHTLKVLDVTLLDFEFDADGKPAEVLSVTGVKI